MYLFVYTVLVVCSLSRAHSESTAYFTCIKSLSVYPAVSFIIAVLNKLANSKNGKDDYCTINSNLNKTMLNLPVL